MLGALWGASFLFMRIATPQFGPVALITLRVLIAGLVLLPLMIHRGAAPAMRQNLIPIVTLGIINSAIPFSLLAFATLTLTAGFTSILNGTTPLWGGVLAWFWLHDRLSPMRIAGLLIGFVGVALLIWPNVGEGPAGSQLGLIAGTLAAALYAIGANFAKKRLSHVPPIALATGTQLGAFAALAPIAIFVWPSEPISALGWVSVLVLGVACTAAAYILYFRLIANVGPANTMTVTYLIPAFAMGWGALALGEEITTEMLIACGVILLGTALATGLISGPKSKPNQA